MNPKPQKTLCTNVTGMANFNINQRSYELQTFFKIGKYKWGLVAMILRIFKLTRVMVFTLQALYSYPAENHTRTSKDTWLRVLIDKKNKFIDHSVSCVENMNVVSIQLKVHPVSVT